MSLAMSSTSAAERFRSANFSLIDSLSAISPDSMLDEGNLTSGITFPAVGLLLTLNATAHESITLSGNSSASATSGGFADTLRIVKISLLAVIFVLILCGNVFVLLALNNRKLKINRMYFFLVHLSLADLITGFFNVLPQLAWEAARRFYGGNVLCKTVKFLQILGPYLSSYVLVMTSIDRYQAICHPLAHSSNKSTSRSRWMVTGAWLISLLSSSPQLFLFSYKQLSENVYECWATFPYPWMPGAYVTFYTFTVFIVPFCILTYTHIIICYEIWLNWHSKRQSLMVKENTTRVKPVGGAKESYLVGNHTSTDLRLDHHSLPHSPLPGSKGSRHSLGASSHFFAKTPKEPLGTTTTLNRHVSSKCSRTLNRLLWICNKSSSVSSNSSAVSTSTNSSASSHRSCSPRHRSHRRSHSRHHHHSTPSLPIPSSNLCPIHDKTIKAPRLSCEEDRDHSGLITATDTATRSNGYGPTAACHTLLQGESSHQKEVQLQETKVLPNEEGDGRQWQLMRHAKSESELWVHRQRKQIRRKRRKLQLLDSVDTGHICASWSSSSSSMSDSSEDFEQPAERKTSDDTGKVQSGDHSRQSRHRRNTLSTITSNMWLRTSAKQESGDINSTPSDQIYPHQVNCPCARCSFGCRCANGITAQLSTKRTFRKMSTGSRPVWKVMKPTANNGRDKSETNKQSNASVINDYEHRNGEHPSNNQSTDTAQSNKSQTSGSQLRVNSTSDNTAIEVIKCDSVSKLNSAQKSSVDLASPNRVYSPVYDFEDKNFDVESCVGKRGSDSHSEPKSNYPVNKLTHSNSSTASTGPGSANVLVPRNYQINRSKHARLSNPRIHSMQGLTRAKIKTVKITLVVITCYVMCSSPFIGVQLWAQYWPGAQETAFWRGPMIAILMLLPSLNSCVNPWIYIYFNPNLVSSFCSLFTRKSSSNSNLHSIGGGKNSNGAGAHGGGGTGAKSRATGNTICGHRTLHKMLTNDSGECSNSMDSRSMRDNSRLDLISSSKETQGVHCGHARSASTSFRVNQLHQMKSCGTATDISVVTTIEDNNSTVTTVTTSTNKLQPVSVFHPPGHHHGHNHLGSNLSSMSNLNEESDTVATYESTVTLSTNSTVTTAGGSLRHPRLNYKSAVATGVHPSKVRKPRRRISIQLDKMWSKIATSNRRSSASNTSSQVGLYHNSKQSCQSNNEQFIV